MSRLRAFDPQPAAQREIRPAPCLTEFSCARAHLNWASSSCVRSWWTWSLSSLCSPKRSARSSRALAYTAGNVGGRRGRHHVVGPPQSGWPALSAGGRRPRAAACGTAAASRPSSAKHSVAVTASALAVAVSGRTGEAHPQHSPGPRIDAEQVLDGRQADSGAGEVRPLPLSMTRDGHPRLPRSRASGPGRVAPRRWENAARPRLLRSSARTGGPCSAPRWSRPPFLAA